jgi:hypothetical protein
MPLKTAKHLAPPFVKVVGINLDTYIAFIYGEIDIHHVHFFSRLG